MSEFIKRFKKAGDCTGCSLRLRQDITQRSELYNVASTSMQRLDVTSTLVRHCFDVARNNVVRNDKTT